MSVKVSVIRFLVFVLIICMANRSDAQEVEIDTSGYLPLFYEGALEYNLTLAASLGYSTEIERLINAGAEVDVETSEGVTPLYFAVTNRKLDAVKMLVNYGADVNKVSILQETPLLISLKNKDLEIAEALIRGGAEINYQYRNGVTALHLCFDLRVFLFCRSVFIL